MNIKTPAMSLRGIMSQSYVNALYTVFHDMRGSDTTFQDDTSGFLYTPNNTFSINQNGTFTCDDSSGVVPTLPATFKDFVADEDMLSLTVMRIIDPTAMVNVAHGSGTTGGTLNRWGAAGVGNFSTSGAVAHDGVGQLKIEDDNTVGTPATNDYVASIVAWDRSVGLSQYVYNITDESVMMDNTVLGVLNAAVTPDSSVRFTNLKECALSAIFTFPSNGLPTTWQADMMSVARAVLSNKSL